MDAVMDLDHVLARHNVGISGGEFLAELDDALSASSGPTREPLTDSEVVFLRDHGGPRAVEVLDQDPEAVTNQLSREAARQAGVIVASTMGVTEAATTLGVHRSRISQLTSAGRLWAFPLGGSKRIPRWQFVGSRLLPGLGEVVRAIPDGLSPQSVEGFMTRPQEELDGTTPTVFLARGGQPGRVADLMEGFGQW